jgi:hypothetical protein
VKKLLTAAAVTAAVAGLSAAPALAGEVTGSFLNGKGSQRLDQNQGRSWCSFSGLNDDPTAPTVPPLGDNGPGGRSQSFGQENKLGISDPHQGNPGTFCNPNRTPLPPQPNRDK